MFRYPIFIFITSKYNKRLERRNNFMDYYNWMTPNIGVTPTAPTIPIQPNIVGANNVQPTFQMSQQQNCPLDNRFAWIPNKEMARTTPMAPDKTILFLNENESYAYFRRTDNTGKTIEFKTFQLIEEKEPETTTETQTNSIPVDAVTKEEFDKFSNDIQSSLASLMEKIENINQNKKR